MELFELHRRLGSNKVGLQLDCIMKSMGLGRHSENDINIKKKNH